MSGAQRTVVRQNVIAPMEATTDKSMNGGIHRARRRIIS